MEGRITQAPIQRGGLGDIPVVGSCDSEIRQIEPPGMYEKTKSNDAEFLPSSVPIG